MFVMTMNRSALRRIGAAALCAAALAAGAAGLYSLTGQNAVETAASPAAELKITGAQDVQTFFAGYGVQVDPSAACLLYTSRRWRRGMCAARHKPAQPHIRWHQKRTRGTCR